MANTTLIATLTLLLCIAETGLCAEKLYRWKDPSGRVYYSDRVPPEHTGLAREQLNQQGISVESMEAVKTPDERAKEARFWKFKEHQKKLIAEQAARDEVLLRTFGNEEELLKARDNRLASLDIIIQIAKSNIERQKVQLVALQKRAAEMELNGRQIPKKLLDEIKSIRQQIHNYETEVASRLKDQEDIRGRFEADLKRFRELRTRETIKVYRYEASKPKKEPVISVVRCKNRQSCDKAWALAQIYVQEHATTRFQIITNTIIMTLEPARDNDISMVVSRNPGEGSSAQLFMDVVCNDTLDGQEFCQSQKVNEIKTGFMNYLESRLD